MKKMRVVELYAGTARSIEPFKHWRRAELALLVDGSEYARDAYLMNHPKAPYLSKDVSKLQPGELLSQAGGRVDILLGCPPCQGFSETGLRLRDDPRNKHVDHFARLACAVRPLAVVMENVPRVMESEEFIGLTTRLESAGYEWTSTIANAAQFGSSQSRQRLLFLALRSDVQREPKFPRPTHGLGKPIFSYSALSYRQPNEHVVDLLGITPASQRLSRRTQEDVALKLGRKSLVTLGEVIKGLPKVGTVNARELQHQPWAHSGALLRRMGGVAEGSRWEGGSDHYAHSYGRLHRRGLARTITTFFAYAGCGRFWHPTENRSLTLREAARIQGFPDDFQFPERSKRSAALVGNALDAALAFACYKAVRRALD